MPVRVFVAGGTGWAGAALCKGIIAHEGMVLAGALSRTHAGKNLADILELDGGNYPVYADVEIAVAKTDFDVFVEYTKPDAARKNVLTALKNGRHVVIGTSGLTSQDFDEIHATALQHNCSVLAAGNFALTAVLLQKFAEMAARYITDFEIIDYAHESKVDAPSGTARELAHRLSNVQESRIHVSEKDLIGPKESRGARLKGVQVHSLRLPGYIISVESIFGMKDERLVIRHEAGASAEPYVKGALLAIEKAGTFNGLRRGLDSIIES
ncbi:MAG: 4-hydroxy-tetrahydrodipicolinate reductase [Bacteroidetes bacterium]|nr:4-hydroxy-tetrahydrodipicolinate reductase [Bacteroidota bacterium]